MINNRLGQFVNLGTPEWVPAVGIGIFILMLWSIVWKGLGLWHAGRRGHPYWFIAILVLNTAGILEIFYIFGILKLRFKNIFTK